ncbi:hypothetical protein EXW38_31195 (plasmid) [Bacillus mycoides]|uniref:hypothetical protein n=1 Tax=Bacillus mycoides TaxID=1405 RepID=UPI001C01139B|nr:hypothetical protein [Bacillus mycoides]QWH15651.1 hypothetical protein EXW38_31195 [Bacillus mycoides]
MSGCCCPSTGPFSPILFFATSTETVTGNLIGAGEVNVLTLGVSSSSPGSHQVKLDSTVELTLTTNSSTINYTILYRLRRSDLGAPLATLQVDDHNVGNSAGPVFTRIPNLTWNDIISTSVTYFITIQVVTTSGLATIQAGTRALNAIVF